MLFSPEEREHVLTALNQRISPNSRCEVCSHYTWTLADGFVFFVLHDAQYQTKPSAPVLPSVAVVCDTCGNTKFLNVIMLGLSNLVQKHVKAGLS